MSKYRDDILRLRAEGKTYTEITVELGCTKSTVCYYLGLGQADKTKARTKDRRSKNVKFVQEYKQSHPCVDCGENYPYWIMEFDHLKDKSFTIGEMVRHVTLERLIEEISKCELVCANCHKTRTWQRLISSQDNVMDLSFAYE